MRHRSVILICAVLLIAQDGIPQESRAADFRFSPGTHLSIISFPGDLQKTLITERGSLAFDFGPGPYARPLTEISFGLQGLSLHTDRLTLPNGRIPIVETQLRAESLTILQTSFTIVPENPDACPRRPADFPVTRVGGLTGTPAWAAPGDSVDAAFRGVAWGTNRPILYRVRCVPGARKKIALGFCEPYKQGPGTRVLEARIEGSAPVTIDPLSHGVRNRPVVHILDGCDADNDGLLRVEVHASPRSPDPNTILNAFWVFPPSTRVTAEEIIRGSARRQAETVAMCGYDLEWYAPHLRMDGVSLALPPDIHIPIVQVKTRRTLHFDRHAGALMWGDAPFLRTQPGPDSARVTPAGWTLFFAAGTRRLDVVVMHGPAAARRQASFPDVDRELERSRVYWSSLELPAMGRLIVPDRTIQFLIDAGIRNVYQVRDCVDGRRQFQPGPAVYRGLWSGDAYLTGFPLMSLGDTAGVREFLETILQYREADGRIRVMVPYNSIPETPSVVASMCLYARFTGDNAWLRERWDIVRGGIEWIRHQRESTLRAPGSPAAGLLPAGFLDGGVAGSETDYSSVWWAMIALEEAIAAAAQLGFADDVVPWRRLHDDFLAAYERAAHRDLRTDRNGTPYLPVLVGDTTARPPQLGQYAFLLPVRYGSFFHRNDSLARRILHGTLTMLDSASVEGLVQGSGWLAGGIWPWLGGAHGIAHLMAGNPRRAQELLYAFARHASPLGTWVEEQPPAGKGTHYTGDASNSQASAVFVHLVRDMMVLERNRTLEFLSGVPRWWYTGGADLALREGLTLYGPVDIGVSVNATCSIAKVDIRTPAAPQPAPRPLVHLRALKDQGFIRSDGASLPDILEIPWGDSLHLDLIRPE